MSVSQKILDPVCDMIVDLEEARDAGLTLEYGEREFGFCAAGCQAKFAKRPPDYIPKVDAWLAGQSHADAGTHAHREELPVVDEGMRRWYSSCRCCLSDAYPKVVELLDRERAEAKEVAAGPGICETEEAKPH
jgi:YHS domain-containing protein